MLLLPFCNDKVSASSKLTGHQWFHSRTWQHELTQEIPFLQFSGLSAQAGASSLLTSRLWNYWRLRSNIQNSSALPMGFSITLCPTHTNFEHIILDHERCPKVDSTTTSIFCIDRRGWWGILFYINICLASWYSCLSSLFEGISRWKKAYTWETPSRYKIVLRERLLTNMYPKICTSNVWFFSVVIQDTIPDLCKELRESPLLILNSLGLAMHQVRVDVLLVMIRVSASTKSILLALAW